VLATQDVLEQLAGRIEHAYGLRRPRWWRGCSTTRVWYAAALRLWEAHQNDPTRIPLDAELFVASQPISTSLADPWSELAQPEAASRFRSRVCRIIRCLRAELKREIRRAERSIRRGHEIDELLSSKTRRLSPLGSYIVARRAGRGDLLDCLAAAAAQQHRSCPLYYAASLAFIPPESYPTDELAGTPAGETESRPTKKSLSVREKYRVFEN
jgi:hypothetical protein